MPSAAESAKTQLERLSQDIPANAPASSEGLPWLRSTATAYAAFIPGATAFIDTAFDDLEVIQKKHGNRVDEIVITAHKDLSDATKDGLDLESVCKAWTVLENATNQICDLAAESTNDIFSQHPDIKAKVGGKLDQLKNMAEDFGPGARRELEDTYAKIRNVLRGGLDNDTVEKIRKLIEDKIQAVEKFGDVAWERGMEEARPYLEKSPKVKIILEENKDSLKHGNLAVLWDKVKDAASSGNTEPVQNYLRDVQERRR
jgi:phage terminase small subunit